MGLGGDCELVPAGVKELGLQGGPRHPFPS